MLRLILKRTRELFEDGQDPWLPPNLNFLFTYTQDNQESGEENLSGDFLENFLLLDDFDLFHAVKMWRSSTDIVLSDLCRRFLSRRLFKGVELSAHPNLPGQLRKKARERFGDHWHYYVHTDPLDSVSYGIYRPGTDRPIRTLVPPGEGWQEISRATHSTAILGLSHDTLVTGGYLFYARELL